MPKTVDRAGNTSSRTPRTVDQILETVLHHEGGFQDDPEDSGNWHDGVNKGTKYGITAEALERYRGKKVTRKDIQNLTRKEAKELYRQDYVAPIQKNLNPPAEILPHLVDMNINHGYGNTAKILQRALGVKVDGKIGPGTRGALSKAPTKELQEALVDKRKDFYNRIVRSRPDRAKFLNGWMNRAESWRP